MTELAYITYEDKKSTVNARLNWRKCDAFCIKSFYTDPLAEELDKIQTHLDSDIDGIYHNITACCKNVSDLYIPKSKYNAYLKPKWKTELKPLHQKMTESRFRWLQAGKPRDSRNPLFAKYKECKKIFRKCMRRLQCDRDRQMYESIDTAYSLDISKFWKCIKQKKSSSRHSVPMKFDDKPLLHDSEEIVDSWALDFEKLYTPSCGNSFSEKHSERIMSDIEEIINKTNEFCYILDKEFTVKEMELACKTLKNGKSPGFDEISGEHLKYGGPKLWTVLCFLFNEMYKQKKVPSDLKKGVIVTIIKNPLKSVSSPKNYRGITLLPVIYKLFEKLILDRIEILIKTSGMRFPDSLQCAYQPGLSSLHASYILQEAISYNMKQGSKVYVCLLDTSTAFDVVWHPGLFHKLYYEL